MERECRHVATITIRSFVSPDEPITGFQPEESFSLQVDEGATLGDLTARYFSQVVDQIGVMAVNGTLASENTILSSGDMIEFYPLLEGG